VGKRSRSVTSRRVQRSGPVDVTRGNARRRIFAALGLILVLVAAAGAATIVIANSAQPVYACDQLLEPDSQVAAPAATPITSPPASTSSPAATSAASPGASPASSSTPTPLGQAAPDLGRIHVNVGSHVTYISCPPASGPHYSAAGQGPVPDAFYPPDSGPPPQGWVHNLEHGEMVVLYRCQGGSCDEASLDALRAFDRGIPPSPRCKVPNDVVVTRFDDMKAPFAAIVWNRVLFLDTVDTSKLTEFFLTQAETAAPEHKC
jgi:hypothetical protein